jgi:hypothetical protein
MSIMSPLFKTQATSRASSKKPSVGPHTVGIPENPEEAEADVVASKAEAEKRASAAIAKRETERKEEAEAEVWTN